MKLFDFLLINAPAEPQSWFSPVVPPFDVLGSVRQALSGSNIIVPNDAPSVDEYGSMTFKAPAIPELDMRAAKQYVAHLSVNEGLDAVIASLEPCTCHEDSWMSWNFHELPGYKAYEESVHSERLKQWPAAWAAEMIKQRQKWDSVVVDYE